MGKKKFIDKKKSAVFHLFARDSTDPNYNEGPSGDRVFIRVDNNPVSIGGFADPDNSPEEQIPCTEEDPDSIFADAEEDEEEEDEDGVIHIHNPTKKEPANQILEVEVEFQNPSKKHPLPDNVRREILELGLPDDGYNYLDHLRIIKNSGFYENSKATLEQLPLDVKAYDATRVRIAGVNADASESEKFIYSVAAKTSCVRIEKVVDPEVTALLEDDDLSRFGSDVEDFEEDFVVKGNLLGEGENFGVDEKLDFVENSKVNKGKCSYDEGGDVSNVVSGYDQLEVEEKPRVWRELDEQFDMLTLKEYGTESDDDCNGSVVEESEPLAIKLSQALRDHAIDELELNNEKYRVPADFKNDGLGDSDLKDSAADLIRRCVEYAEMYDEDEKNEEVVVEDESSDESEIWDCETIVSTYSVLDNHPGKIEAPGAHKISLRGKEKLPVEYLSRSRNVLAEKVNGEPNNQLRSAPHSEKSKEKKEHKVTFLLSDESKEEKKERKVTFLRSEESKEEKKERKAAVKAERREARKTKKEMKGLYRCEAQRAQKAAAITGPSSIRLM